MEIVCNSANLTFCRAAKFAAFFIDEGEAFLPANCDCRPFKASFENMVKATLGWKRSANSGPSPTEPAGSRVVKGFGRRPQHERSGCAGGAGARKPPLEETAGRKGSVAAGLAMGI